jgi:hypothetical protein
MKVVLRDIVWSGPYHFGYRKPLCGPAYCLIVLPPDNTPVYVTAINGPKFATDVLPSHIVSKAKDYLVCYRDIGEDFDAEVEETLENFSTLYGLI